MSKFEVAYPKSVPIEAGQVSFRIAREGRISEEKEVFAEALWNIQGYALRVTLGETPAVIGEVPAVIADEEQAIAALSVFSLVGDAATEAKAIPWPLVFAAVRFFIERFLNK